MLRWLFLSSTSCLLLTACPGPSGTCGPGDVTGSTIAGVGGADTIAYADFTAMENNDCPDPNAPAGVISVTIAGAQSTPAGQAFLSFCLPRPDQLSRSETLTLGSDLQVVDVQGDLGDCQWQAVTAVTGTADLEGYCGVAGGFALTVDGTATLTKHCMTTGGDTPVTVTLSGTALVSGN